MPNACKRFQHAAFAPSSLTARILPNDHPAPAQQAVWSGLAQQEVDHPAALEVPPRLTAMVEDIRVGATNGFEGIGKHRHPVERPLVINRLGEFEHAGCQPGWVWDHRSEGVAEDLTEQILGCGISIRFSTYHSVASGTTSRRRCCSGLVENRVPSRCGRVGSQSRRIGSAEADASHSGSVRSGC